MKWNLKYICETMGNLSGIPVRLYLNNKEEFFFSMVNLPKDPMVIHQEEILSISDKVSYFATQTLNYYGILNIENHKIIIGPTRLVPNTQQELYDMAFLANVPQEDISDFVGGMKTIVGLPLERLIQMLCLMNYFITGKKFEMSQSIIHESQQETLQHNLIAHQATQLLEQDLFYHKVDNTFKTESTLLDYVAKGDIAALENWMKSPTTVQSGLIAPDPIRQLKNTIISTITLASRSAIRGGMEPDDAIRMANDYIYKAELLSTPESIVNLQYHSLKAFTERVASLKFGNIKSKLITDVTNYIQHHLSSPITTQEIADALYLSRPYLSAKFKKETGMTLTDYILQQKISEAKRLLKHTDKPLLSIAVYLGFSSQSHFTRVFKKATGKTPGEYR